MSQVDIQKLQQMVEALTKRVDVLEREYVPNVERRVTRLEQAAKNPNRSGVRPT